MNKETIIKDYQDYKKVYDSIEDKNSNAALQLMGAMSALEHLCPELKESDSEKIRKEIIAILKYKYEHYPKAPKYSNAPQWIAWLEKQGEPTDIPADMTNTLKEEYQKGWDAAMRQLPKEIDSQVWQIANNAAKTWEESFSILCTTQKAYDKGKKDALKEQKPAWSEEDELRKENILSVIEFHGYPAEVDWLKSLKQRYTWKPTPEQVDALQIAIENAEHEKEYSNQNALVSLMEDLKKL